MIFDNREDYFIVKILLKRKSFVVADDDACLSRNNDIVLSIEMKMMFKLMIKALH
jgi:hypothetical protein